MRKALIFLLLIALGMAIVPFATAEEEGHKLERGVVQLATSIIDIPKAIYNESSQVNPVVGVPVGLLKGIGNTLAHVFSGVFNIVTSPFPKPTMDADMFPEESSQRTK